MSSLAQQRDDDLARRVSIQASVSRRVDERLRMLDPAITHCSHAEHVRRLVVFLGEIGALDGDDWPMTAEDEDDLFDRLQNALVDLAADVQAWMESNARNAAR